MPIIRPSSDLRNNYNEISTMCHKTNKPVYITKNGAGDLAIMSIELYEELAEKHEESEEKQEIKTSKNRNLKRETKPEKIETEVINTEIIERAEDLKANSNKAIQDNIKEAHNNEHLQRIKTSENVKNEHTNHIIGKTQHTPTNTIKEIRSIWDNTSEKTANVHEKGIAEISVTANAHKKGTTGISETASTHERGTTGISETASTHERGTTGISETASTHERGIAEISLTANAHKKGTTGISETASTHEKGITGIRVTANIHEKGIAQPYEKNKIEATVGTKQGSKSTQGIDWIFEDLDKMLNDIKK